MEWVQVAWALLALIPTILADEGADYPGAVPPPPGVTPNLQHPPDAGRSANLIVITICLSIASLLFFVRVYLKVFIVRGLLLEDVTCAIAWFLFTMYTVTAYPLMHYGAGLHHWDISRHHDKQLHKWLYAESLLYCPAAYFTKMTLLLLIVRVFAVRTIVIRSIYAFLILLALAYIPIEILKIVVCDPIRSYWDKDVEGTCLNQPNIFLSDLVFAVVADLIILFIPIPLVWKLSMPLMRRLKIIVLLGAGGAATASTIFRLYKVVRFQNTKDFTGDAVILTTLTMVELSVGLICSCLPALNILVHHYTAKPTDRNTPRSQTPGSSRRNTLSWGGLRTKTSRQYSSSSQIDECTSETESVQRPVMNFDLELAMLSGNAPQTDSAENVTWDGDLADARGRELEVPGDGQNEQQPNMNAQSSIGDRRVSEVTTEDDFKDVDITAQLAEVSGNRPWSRIWDGKRNRGDSSSDSRSR